MSTQSLTIELPVEILELLGSAETAKARTRQALILQLLREGEISQGRAARLLGISRWDIIDLMAKYQIPSGPQTPQEIQEEIEAARRLADAP
jgi:predicted HTH domain antitoxin